MVIVQWIVANLTGLVAIASGVLAVVVMVLHLAHKDDVAKSFQDVADTLNKLQQPPKG